ncbi:glycosyltransferase family 4 protein [Nocardioides lianchengensis]|uniref:Glycosyltransferase involved in cell wall bisynthesis n=1 Tax=Nocardioides lianchengensis TaxID=1045774 RepID=A0A1G6WWX3_9ACTN|nr:glycosyltransferase family 4 protein [Nocardioides lianchengensis]NYG09169.1 glycosyltransferase involved in cell wall biosynthesis [Nocardioides lianchengensis]SDD70440.1 Glycosyltransferase involved in cell wall bisynthesis [Nocardioides lianchengensis]
MSRVVQLLSQAEGGPVDHAADVAAELAARGVDSHLVGPVGPGTDRARAAGVTWHDVAPTSKRDAAGAVATGRLLGRLRPEVLHAHDRRAGWLARAAGPLLPGTRVVYTLHGVADGLSDLVAGNALAGPRRRRDRLYYLTGERLVTRWGRARVVTPSAAVASYAVEHVGLPADRVHVVANGVDPDHYPATPLPDGPPTVVWVGLMGGVKRLDVLLDAAERLPDVRVVVVGDGPDRAHVEDRVRRGPLAARVTLTGRVADPRPHLAGAHALALTSAAENCPLVVLQAMASGRPVVATAVGGVPELVRDGVEGRLCAAGDPVAFADALADVLHTPGRAAAMGAAAHERIGSGWTLRHCVDGLQAVYGRAVA